MRCLSYALWLNWIVASSAWAGPPELFTNVVDSRDESSLVLFYDYGGTGLYVSRDQGQTFGLLCSALIAPNLRDGEVWAYRERPDGRMYLGRFEGMFVSDASNCSWSSVPEFEGRWITDLVRDADDPRITYAITSSGQAMNGMFRNDGTSDAWTRVGDETPLFLSRLRVAKTPEGERFYQSATVAAQSAMEKPRYVIRVSDDRGRTWTEHMFEGDDGSLRLLAVDPTNPDRIVVGVTRAGSQTPDDVLWSSMRGQPGTFQKVGSVFTLGGAAFDDRGALFYADNEVYGAAGLFRSDALGAEPRKLSSDKIGCLRFDAARGKLYACRDWLFGAADRETGAFTMIADMRAAERFVGCPDEAATAARCEAQFVLNYCGPGHYPDAPLCQRHYGASSGTAAGTGGAPPAGASGGAGSGAAGASGEPLPPAAGSGGDAGAIGSAGDPAESSGCSVAAPGSDRPSTGLWLAFGLGLILCYRVRTTMVARLLAVLAVAWIASASPASAGPIELLATIDVPSSNPDRIVARWINGDGGIYVSNDGGKTFGMTCYGAAGPTLRGRDVQSFKVAADGGVCVGTVSSLFCSNDKVCGWQEHTELTGQYVADFALDPLDPNVMYLATGTGMGMNGVYSRDMRGGMWKPFGTQLPAWFSRIHVVKVGESKRFYVSSQENVMQPIGGAGGTGGAPAAGAPSVAGGGGAGPGQSGAPAIPPSPIRYFVRYSDDDAKTWTSHYVGEVPDRGSFRLLAVDPTNPDRIVVGHLRALENMPDDLFYSDKRGEPDSFVKIGTVVVYGGSAFLPDGTFFYGDNNQGAPALYKVAKLGEAPVKLSDQYKVGCLHYNGQSDRLYACNDWKLGTVDRASGELRMLLDMRVSESLYECEGEAPMKQLCAVAFNPPNFCDPTHYPQSPVCVENFGTEGVMPIGGSPSIAGMSGGQAGEGAAAGSGAAGMGAAGSNGEAGSRPQAGTAAGAGASEGDGGCSCAAVGSSDEDFGLLGLGVAAGLAVWARAARRKRAGRVSSQ